MKEIIASRKNGSGETSLRQGYGPAGASPSYRSIKLAQLFGN